MAIVCSTSAVHCQWVNAATNTDIAYCSAALKQRHHAFLYLFDNHQLMMLLPVTYLLRMIVERYTALEETINNVISFLISPTNINKN